jgi:hypothetical protein
MKKYFLIMCLSLIATGQALSQITPVNIGSSANSGGGDALRTWAIKYNQADFTLDQKGTASGTDTYTVTIAAPSPGFTTGISALSAYATGLRFWITFTNANTGAATLNINGLGAKSIVKNGSIALSSGDISAGQTLCLAYDGTNLQIVGSSVAGVVTLTGTQTLTNKTLTSPAITTPIGIVKGDVGLGNVDNTSDANKPVSTATQTALDLKVTNPMTTTGDIIVGGSSGVPTRLAAGSTSGHVLTSNGSGVAPSWQAAAGGGGTWGSITGTLSGQTDLQTALDAKVNTSSIFGASSGITGFTTLQVPSVLSNTPLTAPLEFINLGNIVSSSDNIVTNNVMFGNAAGRAIMGRNVRWNTALGKYITPDLTASAYASALIEAGGEGPSLHASPVGSHLGDVRSLLFLASANGPRGVTGITTGSYNQITAPLFAKYESSPGAIYAWTVAAANPMVYLLSQELKGTAGTDTQNEFLRLQTNSSTVTAYPGITFQTSNGTLASPTSVATSRVTGEIAFHAYGGGYRKSAAIRGMTSGTVNSSGAGQSIVFLTSATTVSSLTERLRITDAGSLNLERTVTAGGTTGAQTINKMSGSVNFAAGASSLVVTNSLVASTSFVFCTVQTNDATAVIKNVVPASGSFTINLSANATAETAVAFWVVN